MAAKKKEAVYSVSMFEAEGELNELLTAIEVAEDDSDGGMENALQEALDTATTKRDAVAYKMKMLLADAERDRALSRELAERARQKESAYDRIRAMVLLAMKASGRTELKGEVFRFVKARNPDKVEVTEPELLPLDCVRIVRSPDKKAIADLIESEGHCPGADLLVGDERVDLKLA